MAPDRTIAKISERQFGVFAREQAVHAGFTRDEIDYRLRSGRWLGIHRTVYRMAGSPRTPEGATLGALLAAGRGACASHLTAAWLLKFGGAAFAGVIDITVPGRRRVRVSGARIHRPTCFSPDDQTSRGVFRVTTPERTVFDLAAVLDGISFEDVLDDVLRRGLVDARALAARLTSGSKGHAHHVLTDLLAERAGRPVTGSSLESRFERLLLVAGLPKPTRQYVVRTSAGRAIARVDFAYPEKRIAIELDGYEFHSSRRHFEADRTRQNALVDAGWPPLRFTSRQVTEAPDVVVAAVKRALRRARVADP